jgi:ComF family protein
MGECHICQNEPPPFTQTQAIFRYDYPVNKLIQVAKFHHNLAILKWLGEIMGDNMSHRRYLKERPDVLIPVPLHPKRLRERGYNQSLELAKRIAKSTGIPVNYTASERCRYTKPQISLSANKRRTNLIGAFRVRQIEPHWKHLVLVDDVVTTGATVRELAKIFLQAGVSRVDVWCCAQTPE